MTQRSDAPSIKLFAPKEQEKREYVGQDGYRRLAAKIFEVEKPHIAAGTRLNTPQVRSR